MSGSPLSRLVLKAELISKSFPGVRALNKVSFDLNEGEVHALVGENGAGKSTLMKILGGNYRPDSGNIAVDSMALELRNPHDARNAGIILIYQELSLVPELTAAENILLGSWPQNFFGHIQRKRLRARATEALEALRCGVAASDIVADLSIAQQQMVEIARAFAFDSRVVIFDEPTASLTEVEKDALFDSIRRMRKSGVSIIYISHKMDEIFEISDRITVLRDGEVQGTFTSDAVDEDEVTRLMIGRNIDSFFSRSGTDEGGEVLRLEGVCLEKGGSPISFNVRQGEIVGMYGLVGAGRTELAEAIFGLRPIELGHVYLFGREVVIRDPVDALRLGIGYVPEDRKASGLVLGLGGRANVVLPQAWRLSRFWLSKRGEQTRIYEYYRAALDIKTTGPNQKLLELSGGNQQKYVIAKWLAIHPKLLILDEPTRGIDVGAKAEIHKLIANLARDGVAVVVISSEMPEIMGVSHRVLTMYEGRLTGDFRVEGLTEDQLLQAVTSVGAEAGGQTISTRGAIRDT